MSVVTKYWNEFMGLIYDKLKTIEDIKTINLNCQQLYIATQKVQSKWFIINYHYQCEYASHFIFIFKQT